MKTGTLCWRLKTPTAGFQEWKEEEGVTSLMWAKMMCQSLPQRLTAVPNGSVYFMIFKPDDGSKWLYGVKTVTF